ncbi:hypothetical protein ZWY2020_030236 [Hordeum vulgare]|nr:hypothetical protein ZWY2020_030236 [Hordeum vulgare]
MERLVRRRVVHTVAVAAALLLLLQQPLDAAAANCSARCGGIGFSYPFGIEAGCYHDGFNLTCDHSYRPPKLFLGDRTVEVLKISIPTGTVRVNSSSIALSLTVGAPGKKANGAAKYHTWSGFIRGGQFFISPEKNKFLVLSCRNVQVLLLAEDNNTVNACATYCPPAPGKGQPFQFPLNTDNSTCGKELPATHASGCRSSSSSCQNYTSFAYKGYRCRCSAGYQGNPYVVDGCQDIDECAHWELHSCYGTCTNVPGAFRCQCPDETSGNPFMKGGCIKNKKSSQGLSMGLVASGGSILVLLAFGAPFVTRKIKQQKAQKGKTSFSSKIMGCYFSS